LGNPPVVLDLAEHAVAASVKNPSHLPADMVMIKNSISRSQATSADGTPTSLFSQRLQPERLHGGWTQSLHKPPVRGPQGGQPLQLPGTSRDGSWRASSQGSPGHLRSYLDAATAGQPVQRTDPATPRRSAGRTRQPRCRTPPRRTPPRPGPAPLASGRTVARPVGAVLVCCQPCRPGASATRTT